MNPVVGQVVRRGLCRGCSGLWVGRTGAVLMTVVSLVGVGGGVPGSWSGVWMVGVCRGEGDRCLGSCRSVDLLKHAVEVLGRVIGGEGMGVVGVNDLRFDFMAGGSTTAGGCYIHSSSASGERF